MTIKIRLFPSHSVSTMISVDLTQFPELRPYCEEGEKLALVPPYEVESLSILLRSFGAQVTVAPPVLA